MNQMRIQRSYISKYFLCLFVFGLLTASVQVQSADGVSDFTSKFSIADAIAQADSNQTEESDAEEQYYTYKDGDVEKYVILRKDLVLERYDPNQSDNTKVLPKDAIILDDGKLRIVKRQSWHQEGDKDLFPVFESMSGSIKALPGGVLLFFESELSQQESNAFFIRNNIDLVKVSRMDDAMDAFFIDTDPGLPSLELANQLAEAERVIISVPNWWSGDIRLQIFPAH